MTHQNSDAPLGERESTGIGETNFLKLGSNDSKTVNFAPPNH